MLTARLPGVNIVDRVAMRELYIDDSLQRGRISGNVDWTLKSYNITGSGTHTLKWRYVKDGSASSGNGWVDYVQWTGEMPPGPPLPTEWETITCAYDPAEIGIQTAELAQTPLLASLGGNGGTSSAKMP